MAEETSTTWQRRLDHEFPRGAIARWDDGNKHSAPYLLPRIYAVGMKGQYPVIWMSAFAGSDKSLGPWAVTSYVASQLRPYAVRVTLDGIDQAMLLNAGVDDRLAAAMQDERDDGMRRYYNGGSEVINGS